MGASRVEMPVYSASINIDQHVEYMDIATYLFPQLWPRNPLKMSALCIHRGRRRESSKRRRRVEYYPSKGRESRLTFDDNGSNAVDQDIQYVMIWASPSTVAEL